MEKKEDKKGFLKSVVESVIGIEPKEIRKDKILQAIEPLEITQTEKKKPFFKKVVEEVIGIEPSEEEKKGIPSLGSQVKVKNAPGDSNELNLIIESVQKGVETNYFGLLRFMRSRPPFGLGLEIHKIKDIYTSGETSAYWGNVEARKTIQQEKYAQYMINISQMTKSLFQMLR